MNEHTTTAVFFPSHSGCFSRNAACVATSRVLSPCRSVGCVWIHPSGSNPSSSSCFGSASGSFTHCEEPICGGNTITRTSLMCGSSGSDTPYRNPPISTRRSATHTNFFSRLLGST